MRCLPFYLVLSGEAEIVFTLEGKPEVVGTSRRGELLGEMSLLLNDQKGASAGVRSSQGMDLLMLERSTLVNRTGAESFPGRTVLQGAGVHVVSTQSRSTPEPSAGCHQSTGGTGRDRFSGCRSTWRHHSSVSTFRLALSSFPKWGARYAMNWNTGSQHPWPSQPFCIISGELLLVSNGGVDFGLMRLKRNVVYPGLPDAAGAGIRITLKVIQESRLEISAGAIAGRRMSVA